MHSAEICRCRDVVIETSKIRKSLEGVNPRDVFIQAPENGMQAPVYGCGRSTVGETCLSNFSAPDWSKSAIDFEGLDSFKTLPGK